MVCILLILAFAAVSFGADYKLTSSSQQPTESQGTFNLETTQAENTLLTLEDSLQPYSDPIVVNQDNTTLHNRVMCGYQGWFAHKEDDSLGERLE